MVEYLLNAVLANSGEEVSLSATINDYDVEGTCFFDLRENNGNVLYTAKGELVDGYWIFTIPKETTENLHGRYFYIIRDDFTDLQFPQAIYFN